MYCAVLKPWFVVSKLLAWPDDGTAVAPEEKLNGVVLLCVGVVEDSTSFGEKELGSRDQG